MSSQKQNLSNLNYISREQPVQSKNVEQPVKTDNPYKQQIEQIEKRESGFASKLNKIRNKYDEDEDFGLQTQKIQPTQNTNYTQETAKKEPLPFPSFKTQEIE